MSSAGGRTRVTLAALLAASTLTVMAGAILSPVLELIRRDLALTETRAGLVLTLHGFSLAVVAPFVGRAIDRWGVRLALAWGLLLYGISGGAGMMTESYGWLLTSRLVFGVGAAAVFVATTVALFELHDGRGRDRVMGWRSSAISLGGLGWPLLGGLLGTISWHAPFALYLLGVPLAVACITVVPTRRTRISATAEVAETAPPSSRVRDLARRRPDLLGFYAMQLISAVLLYAVLILLPMRLAELGVTDPRYVALHAVALSASMTAVGLGYAPLRAWLGDRALLKLSFAIWILALAGLSIIPHPILLGAAAALFGTGMGLAVPALTVLIAEGAPVSLRGRATALSASSTFVGQAAAPLLLGPIANARSITTGFAVAAVLAAITLLPALVVGHRFRSPAATRRHSPVQEGHR
ncbi:MFS transporter [Solicola gregarius]|uniref:MFS transporter n=1 Tax=Solicola gregarius TaxID=2908642 RepID=A0AA46TJM7_9ACTN|nr:MFS transporter [Solicola gregarius]UYM06348.1 MFS transporter [Solicola gregarius]